MNTQSSYVYDEPTDKEGLGRIALQATGLTRFSPVDGESSLNNLMSRPIQRNESARMTPKPEPVIDHNPVPTPRLTITALKEAAQKKTRQTTKKSPAMAPKGKPLEAAQKKANAITTQKKGGGKGMLDGRVNIGGYQIKKTRVAVAGGATAGGLLLLKLLL